MRKRVKESGKGRIRRENFVKPVTKKDFMKIVKRERVSVRNGFVTNGEV